MAAITSERTSEWFHRAKAEGTQGELSISLVGQFISVKRQTDISATIFSILVPHGVNWRMSQSDRYDALMRAAHRTDSNWFVHSQMQKVFLLMLIATCAVASQAQKSVGSQTTSSLTKAIDRTLEQGHDAILPPHVSHLLGISPDEHEVPVKQFVQMGEPIRGFEVSTARANDIVIWVESRAQKQTTFYLMSKRGTLRKVLTVLEGTGYSRHPTKDDEEAFEKEKQHWVSQLASKHS